MVVIAKDVATLPNVRKMFIPDPGYVIFDADLSGADAQVVAWEAEDEDLKAAFRARVSVHEKNATDMWGDEWLNAQGHKKEKGTPKGRMYDNIKRGVHGTNYGARPATVAYHTGWTRQFATDFQTKWFTLHPGIKTNFQEKIEWLLNQPERKVQNKFGYHRIYFDRPSDAYTEALAWIPQSTVAETCFRGALQLRKFMPWVEILLQVHDSIVFQVPFHRADEHEKMLELLAIEIPYPDPLVIPWALAKSEKSWGDCKEV